MLALSLLCHAENGVSKARLPAAARHTRLRRGDTWQLPGDNSTRPLPRGAQSRRGRPQSGLVPSLHYSSNADLCSLQHQENISHHFYVLCFCAPCTRLGCSSKERGQRTVCVRGHHAIQATSNLPSAVVLWASSSQDSLVWQSKPSLQGDFRSNLQHLMSARFGAEWPLGTQPSGPPTMLCRAMWDVTTSAVLNL